MKTSFVRRLTLLAASGGLVSLAQAHPGHDDGHEFTWELGHLVANPGATLLCIGVLAVAFWGVRQLLRRNASTTDQSLRGSDASRGR